MLKLGGNNIGKMYLGGQAISKAYLGGNLVWTAAPPLPYDYEVEYIERDCSIPWVDAGGNEILGYFDLAKYLNPDETLGSMRPLTATWSFEPITKGSAYALSRTNGLLVRGALKPNHFIDYSFAAQSSMHSYIDGSLAVFHTQLMAYSGGNVKGYLDGDLVVDVAISGSTRFSNLRLMYVTISTASDHYNGKIRVKSCKIGDDVDLIPVVKDSAVGFYNKVDGELFLEEQACLRAGPKV